MALIEATKLVKTFGLRVVLRQISFGVERGELVLLLGANGSGKTTLLRMISALSRPSGGSLTIGGWSLPKEAHAVRAQIGVVSHLPLLYDDLSAEENLRFFGKLYNADPAHIPAALERVGLGKRSKDLARTFSRGMQQRLALARATLHNPDVLLLDEPYTGLDVRGSDLLDGLLREWHAAGRTIIMSVHDLERAAELGVSVGEIPARALILHGGKIAADVPVPAELPALFREVTA
jgi:heme exporter protein A